MCVLSIQFPDGMDWRQVGEIGMAIVLSADSLIGVGTHRLC